MRLKDKVSIITGGAKGIGQATVFKFVQEGAKVIVVDVDETAINETVAKVKENGGEAVGYKVDITDMNAVQEMVNKVVELYGRIDTLVNNAGIISDAQLSKMTDAQFDRVIKVNLYGTYNCAKAVVDTMKDQKSGVLLNASSIVGVYGNFGQTNYAATKFGVIGMVKSWAKELGRYGIRSNAVCPGFIATSILDPMPEKVIKAMEDKVPMKRLGRPEEIANVYAFLASDEASYMNGAVLEVSGGVTL